MSMLPVKLLTMLCLKEYRKIFQTRWELNQADTAMPIIFCETWTDGVLLYKHGLVLKTTHGFGHLAIYISYLEALQSDYVPNFPFVHNFIGLRVAGTPAKHNDIVCYRIH